MAAVALSPADVAKLSPAARSQLGAGAKTPVKKTVRKATPAPKAAAPKAAPTRRERLYTGARASAARGARQQGQRATGGIGAVFALITTAGVVFAILKNPKLITVPLQFVGSVVGMVGKVFGTASAGVGNVVK